MSRRAAFLFSGFVLVLAVDASAAGETPAAKPASDWPAFQKTVLPFLAKHCLECHSSKKESGDVRLDQFQDDRSLSKGSATLDRVQVMLRKQAMPPKKRPQPGAEEIKPVLAWLEASPLVVGPIEASSAPSIEGAAAKKLSTVEALVKVTTSMSWSSSAFNETGTVR